MKLSTAVEQYLEAISPPVVSKETHAAYKSDLMLLVAIAKVDFSDNVVDFGDKLIQAYFQKMKAKGLAHMTLYRHRSAIAQLNKYLLMQRLIPLPIETPRMKKIRHMPRPLASDVQEKIMALNLLGKERVIRALLFRAGLRVSEVAAVRIGDVQLGRHDQDGTLLVHGKGSKERVVPLASDLWHDLQDHMLASGDLDHLDAYVIAQASGKAYSRKMIERITRRWGKEVQASKVTPHRFRHRFATELLDNGEDIRVVQELLGHADLNTTAVYTHISNPRKRDAINSLGKTEKILSPDIVPGLPGPSTEGEKSHE